MKAIENIKEIYGEYLKTREEYLRFHPYDETLLRTEITALTNTLSCIIQYLHDEHTKAITAPTPSRTIFPNFADAITKTNEEGASETT